MTRSFYNRVNRVNRDTPSDLDTPPQRVTPDNCTSRRYACGYLKPTYRGVSHEISAFIAVPIYAYFLLDACQSVQATVVSVVFLMGMFICYLVSSQYHRRDWSFDAEQTMQRLDHSAITLLAAGSYTPVAILVLDPLSSIILLMLVWGGKCRMLRSQLHKAPWKRKAE
jgi:hemolysin III